MKIHRKAFLYWIKDENESQSITDQRWSAAGKRFHHDSVLVLSFREFSVAARSSRLLEPNHTMMVFLVDVVHSLAQLVLLLPHPFYWIHASQIASLQTTDSPMSKRLDMDHCQVTCINIACFGLFWYNTSDMTRVWHSWSKGECTKQQLHSSMDSL